MRRRFVVLVGIIWGVTGCSETALDRLQRATTEEEEHAACYEIHMGFEGYGVIALDKEDKTLPPAALENAESVKVELDWSKKSVTHRIVSQKGILPLYYPD